MSKERNINYLNKDFSKFKEQLIEFAKNYFPDTYSDFSATSPGMMFIEMAAYVGDIISFYQDSQVQETFLQYAKNPSNLYAMAYMMGYRPKVTTVAETELTFTQIVRASASVVEGTASYAPDWDSAYRIAEYSQFKSNTSPEINFLLQEPVRMWHSSSYDPTEYGVYSWEDDKPSEYYIVKKGKVFSGNIKETKFTFGNYKKFQTVTLSDSNIVGILDIKDSDNNVWTEVPFLGQDTVFKDDVQSSGEGEQYSLCLQKVSRRFVTRFTDKGKLQIQFGAGMYDKDEDEKEFLPNPNSLLDDPQTNLTNRGDVSYDPSNFLFSNSYGLVPTNTVLTVRYIVGGGVRSNVTANTITKISEVHLSDRTGRVGDPAQLSFTNESAAVGGRDGDTPEEVRQNSLRSFSEQKRVVTLQDYCIRSMAMPAKYGSIYKVFAANELMVDSNKSSVLSKNPLAITLYVLSKDINGKLVATGEVVKNNLRTYLSNYIMLTDAVDVKDAYIVNIGVKYDVVLRPDYYSVDVLSRCNSVVESFFSLDKRAINETINLADLYSELDEVRGVQVVRNIVLENKVGNGYSKYAYDILAATRGNILYPSYDPCIFELKYPNLDIEGRVVTL